MSAHVESRHGLAHVDHRNQSRIRNRVIAGLIAGGIALGSFALYESSQVNSSSLPTPTYAASEVPSNNASTTPLESLDNQEALKKQALEKTFDVFLNAIKPQKDVYTKTDGLLTHYYNADSNISDYSSEIPNVLGGIESQKVLSGSFIDSSISGDKSFAKAEKIVEDFELNNINLSIDKNYENVLTDDDKKNGIAWKGELSVSFLERFRTNEYLIGNSLGSDRSRVEFYVDSQGDTPMPNFSDWIDGNLTFSAEYKNGSWSIKLGTIDGISQPTDSLNMADFFKQLQCVGTTAGCVNTIHIDNP